MIYIVLASAVIPALWLRAIWWEREHYYKATPVRDKYARIRCNSKERG